MMCFGIKPCEKKVQIIFNSVFFLCSQISADRKYYPCIQKEGTVRLSKRICPYVERQALGSYEGEEVRVARSHPLFFCQKKKYRI